MGLNKAMSAASKLSYFELTEQFSELVYMMFGSPKANSIESELAGQMSSLLPNEQIASNTQEITKNQHVIYD